MAVSKMERLLFSAFIRKKRLFVGIFVSIGSLLLLLCNCSFCCLLSGEWEVRPASHDVPSHSAEGYALYNFAFGCAFGKDIFVSYSIVKTEKAEEALQRCKAYSLSWDRVATLWQQNAMKRTTVARFRDGETWPQKPILEPIYILLCPSLGVVVGQDPQTHRVNFIISLEGLHFSDLTEWSYPRIQSWEAIQGKVWEQGVPWEKLPTELPEIQLCLSRPETPSPGEAFPPGQ